MVFVDKFVIHFEMNGDKFKKLGDIAFLDDHDESFRKGETKYEFKNETFHATYWIPETVNGAVIICHGYGEYIFFGKYIFK